MTAMACQTLREVRLYGPLRERFGRSHWLAVASPAEAVRALCTMLNGFRELVIQAKVLGYRVVVGTGRSAHVRNEQTLQMSMGHAKVVHIIPEVRGAKRGGVAQFIVGAILVVFGAWTSNAYAIQAGIGMMLGGAIQALSRQRQTSGNSADQLTSYVMGSPVNVAREGGAVPLIIGRCWVGSVQISAGLSTDDISPPPVAIVPPELPVDELYDWGVYDESTGG